LRDVRELSPPRVCRQSREGRESEGEPPYTAITRSGYRAPVPNPPKEVHVRFIVRLLFFACLATTFLVPAATAADRMWVGFHDDPMFRWDGTRLDGLARARANKATILVTLGDWPEGGRN